MLFRKVIRILEFFSDLKSIKLVFKLCLVINEFLVEFLLILLHLVLSDINLVKDLARPRQSVPPEENNVHVAKY